MKQLRLHPIAELFPAMPEDEFKALKNDIQRNGVRLPIIVHLGKIIDGRHRYEACRDLGIECPTVEWNAHQLKIRKAIPVWLFTWLAGIVGTARETDQVGVLVLNRRHARRGDALVVLRWADDWVNLHGVPVSERLTREGR